MPYYYCSLPNKKNDGPIHHHVSDDPARIAAFVAREDVPGRAVYYCPNPLKAGTNHRCIENIDAITELYLDLDYGNLVETPEQIDDKLLYLPLQPTRVLFTGGGLRVIYVLREPIGADDADLFERCRRVWRALTQCLCCDPAPSHPAGLTRVPGTHNSKREGEPVLITVRWGSDDPVDITDLEALLELLPEAGMFTLKPKPSGNGHDHHSPLEIESTGPIDVDQRLADMCLEGPGLSSIHWTQVQCTSSLIRRGCAIEIAVATVLEATHKAVDGDPRAAGWSWAREERDLWQMCFSHVVKNPELSSTLPTDCQEQFEQAVLRGDRPVLKPRGGTWYVAAYKDGAQTNGERGPPSDRGATRDSADSPPPRGHNSSRVLVLRPFTPIDEASLPPREWLYGKHYQRRTVSITAGPGGMGKSSLEMVEAIAMATGRNLLDEQPGEWLRVWYHNGEDPRNEIDRRLVAICKHYKIPHVDLQGRLFTTSAEEFPLRVAKGYANLEIDSDLVKQMATVMYENQIDLAIFDPFVTMHSVPELDTGKMDAVIRLFAGIGSENNAGIDLPHHMRKPAAGVQADYDIHDIRGVAAITDAVRSARVLNRMNEQVAADVGCEEFERLDRFRVDRAKGNYSRASAQAATWRQFVSVELTNGDDVGVVAPWTFPGQGERTPERAAAEQKSEHVFLQLLDKFLSRGANVSMNTGHTYAPAKFAEEREAKTAKVSKAALKAAMNRLLDTERIRSEPSREDGRGHRLVRGETKRTT